MAKNNGNNIPAVNPEFAEQVRAVLNESCDKDDLESCVSRKAVARKMVKRYGKKGLPFCKVEGLVSLIALAEMANQLPGFASRRGRDGGLHRVKVRKPRAKVTAPKTTKTEAPKATASTTEAPAESAAA